MSLRSLPIIAALLTAALAPRAWADTQVATVVGAGGTVEVQRNGSGDWQSALVGTPVFGLDGVRTGPSSSAKLLFVDDAVLDLGTSTEISVEHYGAVPKSKGARRTLLKLVGGTIGAIVSGYGDENSRFEIETPTAVARVQSTQFVVRYDSAEKATDVLGIDGVVAVQGRTGLIGPGVAVGPNEVTRVQQGGFPSPIHPVEPDQRAALVEGLHTVGTGSREGLDVDNPIVEGRLVGPDDRPTMAAAHGAGTYLRPGAPGETLIDSLSPDIRANTQPLPVYRAVPPNLAPVRPPPASQSAAPASRRLR